MTWLQPFMFNALMTPAALLLLAGVFALFIFEWIAKAPGAVNISTGETLKRIYKGPHVERRLPVVLRAMGLALLVFALARPMKGLAAQKDSADIIDIVLCVDVSGSMRAMDFTSGDRPLTRLDVTKAAVRDFIEGRKTEKDARYGLDRLGLVLFAGYAWTQTPLTLDYGILERDLDRADVATDPEKDGTAIGSAIGLAVNKLRNSEAKAKVIILLTDGLNNSGELDPLTATQLAKEYGVKVYTIGAGSGDEVLVPVQGLFGPNYTKTKLPIDDKLLQQVADTTGGRFYRATDVESLHGAYKEINQLETTKVQLGDYYEYKDAFIPWALAGTFVVLVSVLSRRMWFESIP